MLRALIVTLILCFNLTAHANECLQNPRILFYANGMRTSRNLAEETLRKIKSELADSYENYKLSYNDNEELGNQVFDVVQQNSSSVAKTFWGWFIDLDQAPSWFKGFAKKIISKYNKSRFTPG